MDSFPGSDRTQTLSIVWQSVTGTIHVSTLCSARSESSATYMRNISEEKALYLQLPLVALFTITVKPSTSRSALLRLSDG